MEEGPKEPTEQSFAPLNKRGRKKKMSMQEKRVLKQSLETKIHPDVFGDIKKLVGAVVQVGKKFPNPDFQTLKNYLVESGGISEVAHYLNIGLSVYYEILFDLSAGRSWEEAPK